MTSPPLGVGYPDAGNVASLWGDAIVNTGSSFVASGTVAYSGFVGNWSALAVQLNCFGASAGQLTFAWYGDSTLSSQPMGTADIATTSTVGSAVAVIANRGPYVVITLNYTGGGLNVVGASVTPCAQVSSGPVGTSSGATTSLSASLTAGAAAYAPLPTVTPGRGTLGVTCSAKQAYARLTYVPYGGSTTILDTVEPGTNQLGGVGSVDIPAAPTTLQITNTSGSAQTVIGSLTYSSN